MVARVGVAVAFLFLVVLIPLVRLPPAWVELAGGHPWVVRLALVVVVIAVLGLTQGLVVARLPRAVVLWGRKIHFHDGTRRRAVALDEVTALHVEQRAPPQREVFVLERGNGVEHDLCPTHWPGAAALHRALERRVAAAHRRRTRARARRS